MDDEQALPAHKGRYAVVDQLRSALSGLAVDLRVVGDWVALGTSEIGPEVRATNIVVRIKIHLVPRGAGVANDVTQVRSLEDAIEKAAATRGYVLDVVFVDASGPDDVFEVGVDPSQWETAGNFTAESASSVAHEVHHLLGLKDRYNYIISHAANKGMAVSDRLHWFRVQLERDIREGPDPHAQESIMFGHGNPPLDDDVCRVAGLDMATCVAARQGVAASLADRKWTVSVLGGGSVTPGIQGLAGLAGRYTLRSGSLVVFNPYIGLNVIYSPSTDPQSRSFLTGIGEVGLRVQQPLRGAYLDVAAGGYLGFEAQAGNPETLAGGVTGALGAGWRWERIEIGAEARATIPFTAGDPNRILILARVGARF